MDTATPQRGASTPADAGGITSIADDRLEGAEAIGRFIDPSMTPREIRRRLANGSYPHWREGRLLVASKAALIACWRKKTAQFKPGQPQPETPRPQLKSVRRGYRPA
jgi:hypothetical protein